MCENKQCCVDEIERLSNSVQRLRDENKRLTAELEAKAAPVAVPDLCDEDEKEQKAFEDWAHLAGFDLSMHPLHYLFLNEKTSSARYGWTAAIRHCQARINAAPPAPAVDEQELKAQGIDEAVAWAMPGPPNPPDDPPAGLQEYCEALAAVQSYAARLRAQQQGE